MDLNYMGTVHTLKAVLPGMAKRRRGQVVMIASAAAICCEYLCMCLFSSMHGVLASSGWALRLPSSASCGPQTLKTYFELTPQLTCSFCWILIIRTHQVGSARPGRLLAE